MEENAITALPLAGDQSVGFGIWSLIAEADPVVKAVLLLLVLASLWSLDDHLRQGAALCPPAAPRARLRARLLVGRARSTTCTCSIGASADHPMAMLFAAAMEEWRDAPRPAAAAEHSGLLQRIGKIMSLTLEREVEMLERHLSSLATIGATAPFVGLFGTVWGIMNSFQSIAADQEHHARRGRARHRRGAVRDRARPGRGDPGGGGLQQAVRRPRPLRQPGVQLRRRVRRGALARAGKRARGRPWRRPRAA